jgi:probable O-glycosylation ligase (exosortase A-associated)
MRDVLLLVVVLALLPFCVARPYIGLLVWSWLGYMNPHKLTWGFAFNFPFVQLVAVATILGLVLSREPKRIPLNALTITWLLFVAWMGLTTIYALNTEDSGDYWMRVIKIQVMVLITLMVVNDRQRIDWLVWVIAGSIGFYGLKGGVFTVLTGGENRVWGPEGTFIGGNNEVAFALVVIFPLIYYLFTVTTHVWLRRILIAAMVLCGLAILGSYSRGALLAILAMLAVLWLKAGARLWVLPIIVVAGALAFTFMPEQWLERMGTISSYQRDGSALGRINAWWFAFNLANDRPLLGGGFKTFTPELFKLYAPNPTDVHDAHSIFFQVLGEQGYVGLILFLTMGALIAVTASSIIRSCRGVQDLAWAARLAAMLQVSFVGYAVGGSFLGLAYFDLPYQLMALLVVLNVVVRQKLRAMSAALAPGVQAATVYD